MKYLIPTTIVICLALIGTCIHKANKNMKEEQKQLIPVTRAELVDAYIANRLDDLTDSQVLGSVEIGVKGDVTLYREIKAEADERFPKGRKFSRNYHYNTFFRQTQVDKYIFMENER